MWLRERERVRTSAREQVTEGLIGTGLETVRREYRGNGSAPRKYRQIQSMMTVSLTGWTLNIILCIQKPKPR